MPPAQQQQHYEIQNWLLLLGLMIVIATLIMVAISLPKILQECEEQDQVQEMRNLLVSVIQHISGGQGIDIVDQGGLLTYVTTAQHRIVLIPTYHESQDEVQRFLQQPKQANDLYVVIDGEPNPIPRNEKVDYVLTTKQGLDAKDIYVPYYALHSLLYKKSLGQLFESTVPTRTSLQEWQARSFIVFAFSNDNCTRYSGCGDRSRFYQLLVQMLGPRVSNLGKQCATNRFLMTDNVQPDKNAHYSRNDSLYTRFKFVVSFENAQLKGYISEKMINPLFAGAIPVYLGAPDVEEHVNPECFVNVANYPSFEACITDLIALEQDENRLIKMLQAKPMLDYTHVDYLRLKGGNFWPRIMDTKLGYLVPIHRILPQRVVFLTFGYDKSTSTKRIQQEAIQSRLFDDVVCLRTENLPYPFLEAHGEFIRTHQRNQFGFGIWKSCFLQRQLLTMCENDLLVYCESTRSLPDKAGQLVLREQFSPLLQSDKAVLAFRDGATKEFECTKQLCLQTLSRDFDVPLAAIRDTPHVKNDYLIFKRCPRSFQFLEDWMRYANQYAFLDATVGPNEQGLKQHHHDESIFSCLMKIHEEIIL